MSSGKQTSFQYGEVSPRNHYRSNDATYSNSLHTLKNMNVSRTGGVSRRLGVKNLIISPNQDNVAEEHSAYQHSKIFSFPYTKYGKDKLGYINIGYQSITTGQLYITIWDEASMFGTFIYSSTLFYCAEENFSKIKVEKIDDSIYIHGIGNLSGDQVMAVIDDLTLDSIYTPDLALKEFQMPGVPISSLPLVITAKDLGNVTFNFYTAAQYLITVVLEDGREIPFLRHVSSRGSFITPPLIAGDIILAGDGVVNSFQDQISMPGDQSLQAKHVNIYSAELATTHVGDFKLVGRIAVSPAGSTPVTTPPATEFVFAEFIDVGASIASITPPIDFSSFNYVGFGTYAYSVLDTSCSCMYQSRHIIGVDGQRGTRSPYDKTGSMLVSKVGGVKQLAPPIVYRDTEAFSMNVPVEDGTSVVQLITAERLMAFTKKAAYVIAGGDAGVLTPTTIMPLKISSEGSSEYVKPVLCGVYVIYLNANHTKLMAVAFGEQSSVSVAEIGALSEHLLEGDKFVEMIKLPGPDDRVMLLRLSGTAVIVNIGGQGTAGFSEFELGSEGIIESMCYIGDITAPTVMLSVARNGIRTFETIGYKDNIYEKSNVLTHLDSAIFHGYKLLQLTTEGYPRVGGFQDNVEYTPYYEYLNISSLTNYNAGTDLSIAIEATNLLGYYTPFGNSGYAKAKCIYEESGETRFLYLTVDLSTHSWDGTNHNYTAKADIDIPAYLQNVGGMASITTPERNKRMSRFLAAYENISSGVSALDITGIAALYKSLSGVLVPSSAGSQPVAVIGDGRVMSSPLNQYMNTLNLECFDSGGSIYVVKLDLPEPTTLIEIGAPYQSTFQTLPIEVGGEKTLSDDKKIVSKVGVAIYKTVGGFVGDPSATIENMAPLITRDDLDPSKVDEGFSGHLAPIIPSKWTKEGMIKVVQYDPSPMTILSVYPKGQAGD